MSAFTSALPALIVAACFGVAALVYGYTRRLGRSLPHPFLDDPEEPAGDRPTAGVTELPFSALVSGETVTEPRDVEDGHE